MLMRIITLRFSPAYDGFDDAPLTNFIRDKSVLSLREHFFVRNETPYLVVLVVYDPILEMAVKSGNKEQRKKDETWRELLQDGDMPLFDTLRSWRSERSKKDGVPPYVICTNKELAAIVATRPQSLTALMKVDGFGKAKGEKYGKAMLELLRVIDEQPVAVDGQEVERS